ncbi:TPA: hypothetical protein N0F65_012533 [Lagenidium giganteum]|uniref:3'-5' exonuclease domain-containing protein n=1 Tax=Lagenidium giganteum TaxID=4803 RepID=A0AAV2YQC3_9STRA|nr:TPA: hypothetical protein N0F65_012533 [Lagenidium giganteum]
MELLVTMALVGSARSIRRCEPCMQRCAFSSKRRPRYNSSREHRRDEKLFNSLRAKQVVQLERLRAAMELEEQQLAAAAPASSGAASKEFLRWKKLTEQKDERVRHLPLFRAESPLLRRFGQRSLDSYEGVPLTSFAGPIAVIHSAAEESEHRSYLRDIKVVGVDTESRPHFNAKQQSNPVCLIQLATLDRAFIYRLQRGNPLPPMLQHVFENPEMLKIGHSLNDDFRQLKASKLVKSVNSTIDTLPIATKLGCLRPGLKNLCQLFLHQSICKEMQVSDWEAPQLSPEQVRYAATDAWAPLKVLLEMIRLEDTHELLKSKSYVAAARPRIDFDHAKLLEQLRAYEASHTVTTSKDIPAQTL